MRSAVTRKSVFVAAMGLMLAAYFCYFRMPLALNAYSAQPPMWPWLVDVFISAPLLYYFLFRPTRRQLLSAWLAIASAGLLCGRFLNPEQGAQLGNYSLLLIALEVSVELGLIAVLMRRCVVLLRDGGNVDEAMESALSSKPVLFEARIWYYGLFLRRGERLAFRGEQHFGYANNGGNASNQFAFLMVILFEMPLAHLIAHFVLSSPALAWALDALSLWGLLYLLAEYRASCWRPISLDRDAIIIRNGILAGDRVVPFSMVESVSGCDDNVRRQRGVLRYRQMGQLNVRLQLRPGSQLPNILGRSKPVSSIYLSLDKPAQFIDRLRALMENKA